MIPLDFWLRIATYAAIERNITSHRLFHRHKTILNDWRRCYNHFECLKSGAQKRERKKKTGDFQLDQKYDEDGLMRR